MLHFFSRDTRNVSYRLTKILHIDDAWPVMTFIPWEARKNITQHNPFFVRKGLEQRERTQYTRVIQTTLFIYKVVHSNGQTNNNNAAFSYGGLLNLKARIGIRQGWCLQHSGGLPEECSRWTVRMTGGHPEQGDWSCSWSAVYRPSGCSWSITRKEYNLEDPTK